MFSSHSKSAVAKLQRKEWGLNLARDRFSKQEGKGSIFINDALDNVRIVVNQAKHDDHG